VSPTSTPHAARARLAAAVRHQHPDSSVEELRRELKLSNAEQYITRLVDSAPPLTEAQRARLAALLVPADRGAVA
jgi:hypothetical protein